jgi:hypothetical protein
VTFPAYPEVLPLACTATKRRNGDIRMAVAMQKLECQGLHELAENAGGLNGSKQHWLEVYLREFQSSKFFLGVG